VAPYVIRYAWRRAPPDPAGPTPEKPGEAPAP